MQITVLVQEYLVLIILIIIHCYCRSCTQV